MTDQTSTDIEGAILAERVAGILKVSGQMRFICECGARWNFNGTADGGVAVMHALEGHEVVRERFSIGQWYFHDTLNGRTVAEMIWNALREDGEDPMRFLDRMKALVAKKEEESAALDAAEEALGIR